MGTFSRQNALCQRSRKASRVIVGTGGEGRSRELARTLEVERVKDLLISYRRP